MARLCLDTFVFSFFQFLPSRLIQIFICLLDMVGRFKATDADRLRKEYNRLVEGLAQGGNLPRMLIAHSHDFSFIET